MTERPVTEQVTGFLHNNDGAVNERLGEVCGEPSWPPRFEGAV